MAEKNNSAEKKSTYSVCTICDIGCQLRTESVDGRVDRVIAHDNPVLAKNICFKGTAAPHIHNHTERLRTPLKRVGERGKDNWEEISYEQAMDEIAVKLKKLLTLTVLRHLRSPLLVGILRQPIAWIGVS